MSSQADFSRKVNELQAHINKANGKIANKEKCIPTMTIVAAVIPFIVWALLFFLKPSFTMQDKNGEYVRNGKKIALWTTVTTGTLWLALYLFTYCRGYKGSSAFCKKK